MTASWVGPGHAAGASRWRCGACLAGLAGAAFDLGFELEDRLTDGVLLDGAANHTRDPEAERDGLGAGGLACSRRRPARSNVVADPRRRRDHPRPASTSVRPVRCPLVGEDVSHGLQLHVEEELDLVRQRRRRRGRLTTVLVTGPAHDGIALEVGDGLVAERHRGIDDRRCSFAEPRARAAR